MSTVIADGRPSPMRSDASPEPDSLALLPSPPPLPHTSFHRSQGVLKRCPFAVQLVKGIRQSPVHLCGRRRLSISLGAASVSPGNVSFAIFPAVPAGSAPPPRTISPRIPAHPAGCRVRREARGKHTVGGFDGRICVVPRWDRCAHRSFRISGCYLPVIYTALAWAPVPPIPPERRPLGLRGFWRPGPCFLSIRHSRYLAAVCIRHSLPGFHYFFTSISVSSISCC